MRFSLHAKLIVAFAIVILIPSVVGMVLSLQLIDARVAEQARYKVRTDLNLANYVFKQEQAKTKDVAVELRRQSESLVDEHRIAELEALLNQAKMDNRLAVLLVTDGRGKVLYRAYAPRQGDMLARDYFVSRALKGNTTVGVEVLSPAELADEGLSSEARIGVVPTSRAYPVSGRVEKRGMIIKVATPVTGPGGRVSGVLVAASLLNRNYDLVDQIRDQSGGDRATIFLGPIRIATNVLTPQGERALGTVVSNDVGRAVLDRGKRSVGEAWVVDTPYVTAYEPIRDHSGRTVGILFVGTPLEPFIALRQRAMATIGGIAALAFAVAAGLGFVGAHRLTRPIEELAGAARRVGQGDFSVRPSASRRDEVGVLCDEFNKMADRLQAQIEELNRLSDLKSEFVAIASHELRTPLAMIRSYVELINRGTYDASPEELKSRLAKIDRHTSRLTSLLDDLLDLSKLERRELTVRMDEVSLKDMMEDVLADALPVIEPRKLVLTSVIPEDLPNVEGDEERLRRVFVNLLDNSIKFSKAGDHISVHARQVGEQVEVEIADTGAGIAKEDLPLVFSPFFQTESSIRRTHSGLGLGLSLVKNIVDLHGGSVAVDSELGKGTKVIVRLPAACSEEQTEQAGGSLKD